MGAVGRVYLLGAGFSRAVSETHPPAVQKMPLLAELSEAVKNMLAGRQDIPGADTPLAGDFEKWMSYLVDSPPWLNDYEQLQNRAAFLELSGVVHQVLTDRQLFTVERAHPVWLERLVRHWEGERATVITLNYDVLVELAWLLWANDYNNASTDLYWMPLAPLSTRLGGVPTMRGVTNPLPRMTLLKLHGSVNWWYSGPSGNPGDVVYDSGVQGKEWSRLGLFPLEEQRHMILIRDRKPLIVPPTAIKSPFYSNQILRTAWQAAADALVRAQELVIMGFSLPTTDMTVSALLGTRLHSEAKITPVDIGDGILDRIPDIFGIGADSPRIRDEFAGKHAAPIAAWVEAEIGSLDS